LALLGFWVQRNKWSC